MSQTYFSQKKIETKIFQKIIRKILFFKDFPKNNFLKKNSTKKIETKIYRKIS